MNKNQRKRKNNRIDTATANAESCIANQHTKIPHLPLSVALQNPHKNPTRDVGKGPKSQFIEMEGNPNASV
ncbi:unnamed protein product [Musa acuminata subsp. malaccensis]|uniref:(wild Malaysian banana) hypothetical protein n=1 Tax=Musa acuminata subsp. malaccensis TaxID=214687 RepID=A0A8D7AKY1_MUSAM|nr:unnamed protein product [Musa acuminata subsp. malaccensis]